MAVSDQITPVHAPDFERQPPQDLQAEASVLGAMLISKDAIADVVEVLHSGDFYRPAHQLVYDVVLDLYGKGEPADPITVSAELTRRGEIGRMGGAPYLHTLMSGVPIAANAGYYAQIVAEQAVLRRLVEAGTRIVQLGYGSANGQGLEVDDVVDRAQQAVYDVTERRTSEDYAVLEELLQGTLDEIETIGNHGGAMTGVPTGFADLDGLTNGLHAGQMIVFAGRPGMGKALALDTALPTPTGWTTMGEIAVGDQLLDGQGLPTTVVAATDVLTGRPCYEVHFSDGEVIVADAQHEWLTSTRQARRSASDYRTTAVPASVVTTKQLAHTLRCPTADARLQHSVALAKALDLPQAELPLPPYFMGVWAGDGDSAGPRITTADPEIAMYLEDCGLRIRPEGPLRYGVRLPAHDALQPRDCAVCGRPYTPHTSEVRTCGRVCGGRVASVGDGRTPRPSCRRCGASYVGLSSGTGLCKACWDRHGSVKAVLRTLGVLGNKHLPQTYLRASEMQRRELLAGLLDTDGTVMTGGAIQFAVTSRRLAEDVRELIHSLGYRCGWGTKTVKGRSPESSTLYKLTFTTPDDVFRLERKRLVHKERLRRHSPARTSKRYVRDVRPIASVPVRCVQVDNAAHLYLAGKHMIPTHNSTLGLDVARSCSIKHGMTSAIFSLEMSRSEITMRLLAAEAKVPMHHMRSGNMSDDDWARLARRMGEVAKAPLFIDDSPNMNLMEIRAKARRLRQRHDLRLVVVDYLQLMTSPKRVESRQQEVSELSRGLKLLAKELEVPVIAVSQLNRGAEQRTDKKPQLSDLRESGAIEQDSDVVILLHREDAYEKESARAGEADLIVAKHRNGPTQNLTVAFQGHYSRFVDMSPA